MQANHRQSAFEPIPVIVLGALLLCAIVTYFSYLNRGFQLDDALIYHRYVRNVLAGEGLVYNPGERLNALTSPLFSYLSILGAAVLGEVQDASIAIAGVTLALAILTWCAAVAVSESRPGPALLGAALAVSSPYLFRVYGMETPLFLLLIGACLYLFELRKELWLGIAAALLLMTRPEGVFLLLPLAVEHLRQKRPMPSARLLVAPILILSAHYLFTYAYYGAFAPDTAMVKIHQGRSGLWGPWPPFAQIGYHLNWFFEGKLYRALALVGLAILGVIGSRRITLTRVGVAFLVLYTSFYVFSSLPNYHWYYAPYYMFGFFWAGAGVDWLWRRGAQLQSRIARGLLGTTLAVGVVLLVAGSATSTWRSLQGIEGVSAYRQIGEWLNDNAPQEATVAAMEIGTVGWYSRRYMIDIVGLVTPANDRLLAQGDLDGWLEASEPDYVVTHLPEWRMERRMSEAVRRGEYRPVEGVQPPGFQLLEKNPLAGLGRIDELLTNLRHDRDPQQRTVVIDAILAGGMGPVVQLEGEDLIAVNLSPDRWTRATEPAGIVVRNGRAQERTVELKITCLAPPESLPLTVFLEAESGTRSVTFTEAGSQKVELWPVPSGQTRLFTVWSDKAWQPGPKDLRWLGVNLTRAD